MKKKGFLLSLVFVLAFGVNMANANDRSAEITSPQEGEEVSGMLYLEATLNDKDGDDNVQWAVRKGTCAAGTNTFLGNVDGYSDDYDWDRQDFSAEADISDWEEGEYCFIFNPTESNDDVDIRETREFFVKNNPQEKDDCKKGGWQDYGFRNQGQCIRFINTGKDSR